MAHSPAVAKDSIDQVTLVEVRAAQRHLREIINGEHLSDDSFSTIPTIDLGGSFSARLEDRQAVARELGAASRTTGFFYIRNHGVSDELCARTLALAERFFRELSRDKKEALHMSKSRLFRGWKGSETEQASRHSMPELEMKEAFNWGYQAELDVTGGDGQYAELDGTRGMSNVWPREEDLPGFFDGIREYYGQILQLSRHLFRLFALSLKLPEAHFDAMTTHPGGIARLLYYPALGNNESQGHGRHVGIRPHSDFECFTVLLQSDCAGLQAQSPDGKWVDATPMKGALVVNIGDFMMRMTNGLYKSTAHRVLSSPKERWSIPFFFSVNYDATVDVIASCVSEENPAKYPPVTAGQYVLERLRLALQDHE
ncbi:putative 2OG-Fe(II) oxygenase family oxidoreductase [Pyrenochaeta sp. MPI-SDFR-AT-0127]|nr:putative 2OG-Fe(II) oxygenase family oxidoreductase [Pyrenochaeta sp. MPI-SDFR-AT-0127]